MKKLFLLLLAVVSLIACEKDPEEPNRCPLNNTSIVGNYKIVSLRYKANAVAPEVDYTADFYSKDCQKDDILQLKSNGIAFYEDAGIKCTPVNSSEGEWLLEGNKLKLEDTDVADGDAALVETFDCNGKMVLLYKDYDNDNDQLRITLMKQ